MTQELEHELKINSIHMAEMKKDIEYIKESQVRLEKQLVSFINTAPEKFASKIVEKIVYGMVGVVLVGVLAAIVVQTTSIKIL